MNYCGATGKVSKDRYAHNPDSVTPRMFVSEVQSRIRLDYR